MKDATAPKPTPRGPDFAGAAADIALGLGTLSDWLAETGDRLYPDVRAERYAGSMRWRVRWTLPNGNETYGHGGTFRDAVDDAERRAVA